MCNHRRRAKTEEKAKVVASVVWGEEFIPCRASCFALDDLNYRMSCSRIIGKKRMNLFYSSKSSRQGSEKILRPPHPNRRDDLCLIFCLYPCSMTVSTYIFMCVGDATGRGPYLFGLAATAADTRYKQMNTEYKYEG